MKLNYYAKHITILRGRREKRKEVKIVKTFCRMHPDFDRKAEKGKCVNNFKIFLAEHDTSLPRSLES